MKSLLPLILLAALPSMLIAQTMPSDPAPLASKIYDWEKMTVTPTSKGVRRDVFDGPTATLDKAHCHITTLNPGENSGEPRRHLQEEIIIVKDGTVESAYRRS